MKQQRRNKVGWFLALLVGAVGAARASAQMQSVQVPSAVMQRAIPATVTVPKDYPATTAPCPVLYLLHGAGDDAHSWVERAPVQDMADQYGIIIVSPNAEQSWYFDSPENKNSQFETFVAAELVQYVDAHYRTIPQRAGRALAGNSMGGQGAMFLAIRHKDVFSAAAPMSGGMDIRASDPQVGAFPELWGIKNCLGTIAAHPERWNELTVMNQVNSLKNGELAISMDCGTEDFFRTVNRQLHDKLTAMGIAHNYVEYPGAHGWNYWKLALPRQMAFLSQHLQGVLVPPSKPGDADYPQPSPSDRHNQKVAAIKTGHYDLVLIGDSITGTFESDVAEWEPLKAVWNKHFAPRHALNLGYGGYRTENILWNLQNGELDFAHPPKVMTLLIGTNNTDDQHYPHIHTAEQVFAGTKAIVELIRKRLPTTKIIVLRIFPCGGPGDHTPYQRKYNRSAKGVEAYRHAGELTAQLADGQNVFWLDIGHVFLRPDGGINTALMPDMIHPNAAGAEAWAQAIEPTLAQLMGDQPIVDAPDNPYIVPATNHLDFYDWMGRHNAVVAAKYINPKIIFIGDSITHFMGGIPAPTGLFTDHRGDAFWTAVTKDRPGLNLGFGADGTQHVLWRIDHGELDGLAPQRVVLMIGVNNVWSGDGNCGHIIAGIRACLLRIRAKVPQAKITLMGILPCRNPATQPTRAVVIKVNQGLAALAKEARIDFLDIGPKFLDAQGNIPVRLMDDALHPTPAGYEIWRAALEPELK